MQTASPPTRAVSWRVQLVRAALVVITIEVGLVLLTLPWTRLWTHSIWMTQMHPSHPRLWASLRNPGLRGAVSGLGLINLWIAASEIVPFRG